MRTVVEWSVALTIAGMGPLLLWVGGLEPPWPQGASGKVALLLVSVCVFSVVKGRKETTALSKATGKMHLVLGSVVLCVYLALNAVFVVSKVKIVQGEERFVRIETGYQFREELRQSGPGSMSSGAMLDRYGNDPGRVWTPASLAVVRLALVLSFSGGFALLAAGVVKLGQKESS